jgi:FkbH-like protein
MRVDSRTERIAELRAEADRAITTGDAPATVRALTQFWQEDQGPAAAGFVASRFERLRDRLSLVRHRVEVLRSFTVEPVVPLLRAGGFVGGIDLTIQVGDFNTYAQEILDPASRLYAFGPDTVFLAVQTRDVAPDLWNGFAALSPDEVRAAVERVAGGFRAWAEAFRANCAANLVIHALEVPAAPAHGVLDHQTASGQVEAIHEINRELRRVAADFTGVYVLDYDGLIARHGRARWHDERRWLTARLPLSGEALGHLAAEWLRFLHPLAGRVCKVLVADLDNTLWGGVVGEDGVDGIKIGADYPGAAHLALQQAMLDLRQRGVILAMCSKNNEADALEALRSHPRMLLRPEHFAALRINWTDKARNLREIAAELNLGLDSLAFIDDNPVERQQVRSELPEVTVIDLPTDPMGYAAALRDCPVFERLAVSAEDRERGRHYAEQRQREELRGGASSLEEFYHSLRQVVTVAPVRPAALARVAQLTQKTNQFNLTTRRYTEPHLAELFAQPGCEAYCVRVRDRFGDYGLVGVVITRDDGAACGIDTFLLSCRVIGRTVETAVLAEVARLARERGRTHLRGWFLPTKKNGPARDVYPAHGFRAVREADGGTLWELDLGATAPTVPEWITLESEEPVHA